MNINLIPDELKPYDQWICWRNVYNRQLKKNIKIQYNPLYDPYSRMGSDILDVGNLCSFEQAIDFVGKYNYDGIGFYTFDSDPFCLVDLDNCLDSEGQLTQLASNVVRELNTYTEISPSGKGLHLIYMTNGFKPKPNKAKPFEHKINRMYLTITSNIFDGYFDIRLIETTDMIDWWNKYFPVTEAKTIAPQLVDLDDKRIIYLASNNRKGYEFLDLFQNRIESYFEKAKNKIDVSDADYALCCKFAFYTKDIYQIKRLFLSSDLAKDRAIDDKYLTRTIEAAIRATPDTYDRNYFKNKEKHHD